MNNEPVSYVSNINYSARSLNKTLAIKKLAGRVNLKILVKQEAQDQKKAVAPSSRKR